MGLNQSVQWGNCSSVWKGSRQKILHLFRYIDEKNKQTADLLGRSIATSFIPWWGARLVSGTEVVISTGSGKKCKNMLLFYNYVCISSGPKIEK